MSTIERILELAEYLSDDTLSICFNSTNHHHHRDTLVFTEWTDAAKLSAESSHFIDVSDNQKYTLHDQMMFLEKIAFYGFRQAGVKAA